MSISTAAPALGKRRMTKSAFGLLCIQARPSFAYMPGAIVGHRAGVQIGETPLAASPRADLVIMGEVIGQGLFTASATADSGGGAVDADGVPQMLTIRPGLLEDFATAASGVNQITANDVDKACFAYDDDTVYLTDLGGTLSFAGFVDGVNAAGKVTVRMGSFIERSFYTLFSAGQTTPGVTQNGDADFVITTIAAYTGSLTGVLTGTVNGALGTQDSTEAPVVGKIVYLPLVTGGAGGATVSGDEGPYEVTAIGAAGAKFVLTRPEWWQHGDVIKSLGTVQIKHGTIWGGNAWRAFPATDAKIVGTDASGAYPRTWSGAFIIGTTSSISTGWIRSINRLASTNILVHAFGATTLTAGAGTATLAFTGTAADTIEYCALNY